MKNDVQIESKIRRKAGVKSPSMTRKLAKKLITDLNLDLSRLIVLTEAASRNFIFASLIDAMAGARVIQHSKTTIQETDIDSVISVLKSDIVKCSHVAKEVEERFAEYVGMGWRADTSTGTSV